MIVGTHNTATPLALPLGLGTSPFITVDIGETRSMAHELLGTPHLTELEDGLGDVDYWAFSFACGLRICYRFAHWDDHGVVTADLPEIDHVIRHLPFPVLPVPQPALPAPLPRVAPTPKSDLPKAIDPDLFRKEMEEKYPNRPNVQQKK